MIKKYIIGMCVSAGLLCGCAEDKEIGRGHEDGEIVLNAVFDGESRVSAQAFDKNDQLGVFVTEYDGDTETLLKSSGNYVDNHLFTATSSALSTEEPLFYPQVNNVDIYGYYPYQSVVTSVDKYPFAVVTDQSKTEAFKASDFVWAKRENVAANNSVVNLSFRHRLAKIAVNIEAGTEIANLDGLTVTVCGMVGESTIDLSTGQVTPLSTATTTRLQPLEVTENASGATKRSFEAIVVPQVVAEGAVLVEAELNGKKYSYRVGEGGQIFGSGKQQNYDLIVNAFQRGLLLKSASVTNWVSNGANVNEQIIPDVEGRDVLMALYNATDGQNWTNKTNWGSDKPVGEWYGVTVEDNEIVAISLANNGLKGKLPIGLTKLSRLRKLLLNDNALTDCIPAELGNMNTLQELNLANNQLTQKIPATLGRLRDLTLLNLRGNRLSGVIPRLVTYLNCYKIDNLALQYTEDGVTEITLLEEDVAQEGEIYYGDIEFTSQAQINTFALHGYTEVVGNLVVKGDGVITNIPEFTGLKKIHGHLYIENGALEDFTPFKDVTYIGGDLGFSRCSGLKNLTDNDKIEYIGGMFYMNSAHYRATPFEISGFNKVTVINKGISISDVQVRKISGFENLTELGGGFFVTNDYVEEISGFTNLKRIQGRLNLSSGGSPKLKVMPSFPNLEIIEGEFELANAGLIEVVGLNKLKDVDEIIFQSCPALEKVSGFESLETISGAYGDGILFVGNSKLVEIPEFNKLVTITGNLSINACQSLVKISGFTNLQEIGKAMQVLNCPMLERIEGFDNLSKVVHGLDLRNVSVLQELSEFPSLEKTGCVSIENTGLENISGFNALEEMQVVYMSPRYVKICGNNKLKTISGFNKIVAADIAIGIDSYTSDQYSHINSNPVLKNITGFKSLTSANYLYISGNSLTSLEGLSNLTYSKEVGLYKCYLLPAFPFAGLTGILSSVDLRDNTSMEDYTNLQPVINENTKVTMNNNKYTPTKEDILVGKVKPE